MKLAALLLLGCGLLSAEPRLFYSKYFKGSLPEYVAISVAPDGAATFQDSKEDENPLKIQLSGSEAREMFDLAQKLEHFQHPVESGLKVANMGTKTFGFEDGAEKHTVDFNYSQDVSAQALQDWFERITESEEHYINLDRTVHYDKLGVNDVLLQLEISWEHKRLVDPSQFLPLLDRIVKNDSFLHISRERAAEIGEAIRKLQPNAEKQAAEKQ
jgi:hypothetical protein